MGGAQSSEKEQLYVNEQVARRHAAAVATAPHTAHRIASSTHAPGQPGRALRRAGGALAASSRGARGGGTVAHMSLKPKLRRFTARRPVT